MIRAREPKIRISRVVSIFWPFLLVLLVYLLVQLASANSPLVEAYYSKGIYPFIAKSLSTLSNFFYFSLWDSFWIGTILFILSGLILSLIRKIKWRLYFTFLIRFIAIGYAFFYLIWGLNYFRPKIETRLSWHAPKTEEAYFRIILDSIISQTNRSYISISPNDYITINQMVENSYSDNSSTLGINYPNGSRRPKTMLFSSFFAKSGVSGYFGPFFNEIHLNYYLLPMEYPFVLAHEKAHQFGITNEAEANLAAFVVCTTSKNKLLNYSGYVNLLVYFLADAVQLKDVKDYIRRIDQRVILDLKFQGSHWQGLRNKALDRAQTAANNAYLKTNHIEEGVKNYNKVVSLVISWYNNSHQK